MKVKKYLIGHSDRSIDHEPGTASIYDQGISQDTQDLLHQTMIGSSDARFEPGQNVDGETPQYKATGSAFEVALLNFLIDHNTEANAEIIKREERARKLLNIPFCPEKRTSFTVRMKPDDPTQVNIFSKGAPESIIRLCENVLTKDGELMECIGE